MILSWPSFLPSDLRKHGTIEVVVALIALLILAGISALTRNAYFLALGSILIAGGLFCTGLYMSKYTYDAGISYEKRFEYKLAAVKLMLISLTASFTTVLAYFYVDRNELSAGNVFPLLTFQAILLAVLIAIIYGVEWLVDRIAM